MKEAQERVDILLTHVFHLWSIKQHFMELFSLIMAVIFLNFPTVTYQFEHNAGFGIDGAKSPIRKSLQPCPVTLEERKHRTAVRIDD